MRFQYQLTRKDLGYYSTHYFWKKKIVGAIFNAVVMLGIVLWLISSKYKKVNIPVLLFCMAVALCLYFLLLHLHLKRYGDFFKENGPMLSRKEVELTEEYFSYADEFGEAKMKWRSFSKIETGKHAVYLFMDSPSAVIIPKSAFENEARVNEFISYVNERMKANMNLGLSF